MVVSNIGTRHIRPTSGSPPDSRESSDNDIYGPSKYNDHQMQQDMIHITASTSPNYQEYQNTRPYQTSWNSGDFHPSAYQQSSDVHADLDQYRYMNGPENGVRYMEDVDGSNEGYPSDHYPATRATHQYYRGSHTTLPYRQPYHPTNGPSNGAPYENVDGYQAETEESSSDDIQEHEKFELDGMDWKPDFKIQAHGMFLLSLNDLWKKLTCDKDDADAIISIEPADPVKAISNILEGVPVNKDNMLQILQLFRTKGNSLAMITNGAGFDICDVIIQSPDLFVQSLLPFLIQSGYTVHNSQIPRNRTHLHLAWQCGNKFAFYTLLQAGVDPNELYGLQKQTLLHHMLQMLYSVVDFSDMEELHMDFIGILLNKGANVATKNANGMTCADYCDYRILRLLRTKLKQFSQPRKRILDMLRHHLQNKAPENVCSFLPRVCNAKPPNANIAPKVSKTTLRLLTSIERRCYNSSFDSDQEL